MSYGYFDGEERGYVVTRPNSARRWG